MKISRVKIYMKFRYLFLSIFKKYHKSKKNIEDFFKFKLKKKYISLTGMCRTGFILTLDYLIEKYPEKNEIIICSYNLEEMVDIARIKNFKIKLLDINLKSGTMSLNEIEQNCNSKTAAILFTNMFNDVDQLIMLKEFCKNKNILLVEDNAIYYGNFSIHNEEKIYAGSFGDVSLLSFGIMKNISAIYGGAVLTSNEQIFNFINSKLKTYKEFPKLLYLKNIILFLSMKILLSKFFYNFVFFYIIKFATVKNKKFLLELIYPSLKFKKKKNLPQEYLSKISPLSVKIIEQTIIDKDFKRNEIKRRENNKLYYELLKDNLIIDLIPITNIYFQNFLDFPILIKNNLKDQLVNYLFLNGLETRVYFYPNCESIINQNLNINSKYFEKNLICLPSHQDITDDKIKEYSKCINKFLIDKNESSN